MPDFFFHGACGVSEIDVLRRVRYRSLPRPERLDGASRPSDCQSYTGCPDRRKAPLPGIAGFRRLFPPSRPCLLISWSGAERHTAMNDSKIFACNRRSNPHPWLRGVVAFLAFLALALGSIAPHDMVADQVGRGSKVEIAESAVHPGEPAHFEAAEIKVHPGCVACLLQLETRTVLGRPPVPLPPLARDASLAAPVAAVPAGNARLFSPARAPPIS